MRGEADESWEGAPGMRQRGGGEHEKLFVRFEMRPKQDAQASAAAGRPVFADVEYIEIAVPGDKSSIIHKPVTDELRRKFRAQYQDWKAGNADAVTGTPLAEWPAVTRSQVEELLYFKIRTVEQLAGVSDGNLQHLGHGYLEMRKKAADYLASAKDNAPLLRMSEALVERDASIALLQRQLKELGDRFEAQARGEAAHEVTEKRGPGRPRKSESEA